MTNTIFHNLVNGVLVLMLFLNATCVSRAQTQSNKNSRGIQSKDKERLARFEKQLEELRSLLKIPGASAVVIKDRKVLWAKGFGFADLEKRIPATIDTPYSIASLTKTFASTLVMQLVEQEKLNLDEPMAKYSNDFKGDAIKIRHILTHTSEGIPGERYQYSGNRYDYLTAVIEKTSGKSFRELFVKNILEPLKMSNSVPGHDILTDADKWTSLLDREKLNRYETALARMAKPYRLYGEREIVPTFYPPRGISAAAGLISTGIDLARYDVAIDTHILLKKETQDRAWMPAISSSGQTLPHGLGWFVQNYRGLKLIWHFGNWGYAYSSLIVKVPEKNLTFILLGNSEAVSDPFFKTGGVESSPFACSFMRLFVFEDFHKRSLPDPHWTEAPQQFSAEISRLEKQTNSYPYSCEQDSHAAMMEWLADRRAHARTAIKLDSRVYDSYAGRYQLNANRTFTVSKEGDRLFIDIPRSSQSELFPAAETEFFLKAIEMEIMFVKGDKDQVTHLIIRQGGRDSQAKKIR